MSARNALHHLGHAAQAAGGRDPGDLGACLLARRPGHARGHDREAVVGLPAAARRRDSATTGACPTATTLRRYSCRGCGACAGACAARTWRTRSNSVAARQRDNHVTAGHLGFRGVGQDRDHGGQADARVQYLAELVGADTDEAGIVTSGERHDRQPEQWQAQAESEIRCRGVTRDSPKRIWNASSPAARAHAASIALARRIYPLIQDAGILRSGLGPLRDKR